jgi:hypothetical protein
MITTNSQNVQTQEEIDALYRFAARQIVRIWAGDSPWTEAGIREDLKDLLGTQYHAGVLLECIMEIDAAQESEGEES